MKSIIAAIYMHLTLWEKAHPKTTRVIRRFNLVFLLPILIVLAAVEGAWRELCEMADAFDEAWRK